MTPPLPSRHLQQPWSRRDRPVPRRVVQPLQRFLQTEISSGILLLAAAIAALAWANSPAADSYTRFWETPLTVELGGLSLSETLRDWINDLLMALFFFVAGLEIKRELVHGELREDGRARSALPGGHLGSTPDWTIAGVALGLERPGRREAITTAITAGVHALDAGGHDIRVSEAEQSALMEISRLTQEAVSPLERLLRTLHPWSSFVVLPVFALANAGVNLSGGTLAEVLVESVTLGVIAGLVAGKPVGIMLAAVVMVRTGAARLPSGATWPQVFGVAALAGIGFTVSIFVTGLAFTDRALAADAQVGILIASLLAGLIGSATLLALRPRSRPEVVGVQPVATTSGP